MALQLLFTLGMTVAALGVPASEPDTGSTGNIWAVLVAGSNGYDNYRHQANVCHAYQIFHRHGIPDSNIIVMMYDDIAYNERNPLKGVIRNRINGPNVYEGVHKDYTGKLVTPENFINILTGNKQAMLGKGSSKVLESGPNDHVFIYFTDHGDLGAISFPEWDSLLLVDELMVALKTMNEKKMYKKLVFYLEACHSGSMFENHLPDDLNIYAVSSAKPNEWTYACYLDPLLDTALGDQFSVAWMEDLDSEERKTNLKTETLLTQFNHILERGLNSTPTMYGEKSIAQDKVKDYFGVSKDSQEGLTSLDRFEDSVPIRDVALHILEMQIEKTEDKVKKAELKKKLYALLQGRWTVDEIFSRIIRKIRGVDPRTLVESRLSLTPEVLPCYKTIVQNFRENCINISKNTYVRAHMYKFVNLCAENVPVDDVIKVFTEECTDEHRAMSDVN